MVAITGEGNCEVYLLNNLIERGCLIFSKKDILDRKVLHLRQPKMIAPVVNTLPIQEEITFYRVGDTQRDEFDLSCFGQSRKERITIKKICTKPEIEILIIINEGLYTEYLKVSSSVSPKEFVKNKVKKYTSFNDYIDSHDMVSSIKEYKRLKKHEKDELYLADLLKE